MNFMNKFIQSIRIDRPMSIASKRWTIDNGIKIILFLLFIQGSLSAQTINRAEYFFDADPGVGNATALSVTVAASINQTYNVSTASLATGFHTFNARVQDNTGKWSLFTTRTFYVIPNPFSTLPGVNITKAEYFYDTDPGVGNGANIPVASSPSLNLTVNTPSTALTAGFHTVNVRVRDDKGRWSLFTTRTFYLMPTSTLPADLVKLEYYVNTDPGIGLATSVPVTQAPTVNQLFNLNLPALTPGNYTLNVRAKDSKGYWSNPVVSAPFTIIACTPPAVPTATPASRCGVGAVTLTASGAGGSQVYRWYADAVTPALLFTGASFSTPSLTATTTYYVSIFDPATCESNRVAAVATINNIPVSPTVTGAASCGQSAIPLLASGGSNGQYRWYTASTGGTAIAGEVTSVYTTPVLNSTTTYYVAINNGICESARTPVVAAINAPPAQPIITGSISLVGNALTICSTSPLTLSAPAGFNSYAWSTGAVTQQISVSTSGNYSVTATDAAGCASPVSTTLTITVLPAPCNNQAPVINSTITTTTIGGNVSINLLDLISDADNNLVLASLSIAQSAASGANATIINGILEIDYKGVNFSGRDQISIQVCDAFGECTQQVLEIDLIGDIEIYNGISPNGDEQNDIFFIRYIDLLQPENKVTIYNRWGSKVFEVENYNNDDRVFKGLNDNGNELPSGTYFYKIEFASGLKSETGYLALKR